MEINRTNYEIWLIDWLDGNLNNHQVAQLKEFLDQNPDIKEEVEELASITLEPETNIFTAKENLKRSPDELSSFQFEHLCVAYIENDLSKDQQTELIEIINKDPEKRKTFELIQKTKLAPPDIKYRYKSKLLRRTLTQKVLRISVMGLSAAAAVALIIMTYVTIPREISVDSTNTAQNTVQDSTRIQPLPIIVPDTTPKNQIEVAYQSKKTNDFRVIKKSNSIVPFSDVNIAFTDDSAFLIRDTIRNDISSVPLLAAIDLGELPLTETLIASNLSLEITPVYDDRSNVSRFITKLFREKILKDNNSPGTPLKGYEIAEVGVSSLNKLLGWEMALDKRNDENGELKSVYFSSKIVKFNAPVKKSEPLP